MIQPHYQMEPISLPNRRPTAFLLSLVLHLALGALLFAVTANVNLVPKGVHKHGSPTYIEFAPAPAPATKPESRSPAQPSSHRSGDILSPKVVPQNKSVSPAATQTETHTGAQFGVEDGTIAQGELGDAAGFKATDLERYLFELRVILANRKIYPATSKRLGETGRVVVKFNIHRSGKIENLAVEKPSDYTRLNEAALKLVSTVETYKPFPEGEKVESLAVEVPIDYVLN